MRITTGLSIFNKQWLIEPTAALQMLDFWMKIQEGGKWDYGEAAGARHNKFFANFGVIAAPNNSGAMSSFDGFGNASVVVISISGPLMKDDNCGDLGTASLKQLIQVASNTPSIHTIIFDVDSPGGTVDGTKALADVIKACGKRTIALVNGLMCSAAYWIGSACNEIYASCTTDIIGSIGTMCALVDSTAALEKKGYVIREYYATGSTDKNKMFTDAEKGDGKALISEMLDPMNSEFLGAVKANRGSKLNEEALTGKTYMPDKAMEMGLIDGIKSFEEVMTIATINTSFNQSKNTAMTAAEFKAAHPTAHAEIFEAGMKQGIEAERDRTAGWQAWKDTDPEAVAKGIEGGGNVTQRVISEMSAKAFGKASLAKAETENADAVQVDAPAKPDDAEKAGLEANTKLVLKAMGL